eukprot:CAMPEP_0174731084 /NCGR_PEP_ID=MMETSP1094-20130205/56862_1 /TAXON_ID=156173 /ORGANISM="Chrysochromulina brevifilum, Strain UTEX LB 985" /LENGTH=122 /DNA_ID=CAMNT_0015933431 /DNA_START=179 /DNA_END=547 /DNA_ORIENTATION=-
MDACPLLVGRLRLSVGHATPAPVTQLSLAVPPAAGQRAPPSLALALLGDPPPGEEEAAVRRGLAARAVGSTDSLIRCARSRARSRANCASAIDRSSALASARASARAASSLDFSSTAATAAL